MSIYHKLSIMFLVLALGTFESVLARGLPDLANMVEEQQAAVVNISTVTSGRVDSRGPSSPNNPEFEEFLRRYFGMPRQNTPRQREVRASGSGFIIDKEGYILTNNHVIDGADEIKVSLSDRRELVAEVIGVDEQSDLALLKIDADNLSSVQTGDSDDLRVGEWVLAIGSPFGFRMTATAGIVSGTGRSLQSERYVPFIQTDVAINPGNSGGPLFNMKGEVIGINSQIFTRSGGYMGISFAIPINMAMTVVDQLKDKGYFRRGWLGVSYNELSQVLAETFGLDKPHGALVVEVIPDSPADDAGIQTSDIIVKFNGRKLISAGDLPHLVGQMKIEDRVKIELIRKRKKKTLEVVIGEVPDSADNRRSSQKRFDTGKRRYTIEVKALTDSDLNRLKLDGGVLVKRVGGAIITEPELQRNDIIIELNFEPIENVDDFYRVFSRIERGSSVPVTIIRVTRQASFRRIISLKIPKQGSRK